MKRYLCAALILVLMISSLVPAQAEGLEIASETAEAAVAEVNAISAEAAAPDEAESAGDEPAPEETDPVEDVETASEEAAGAEAEPEIAAAIQLNVNSITIGVKEKYDGLAAAPIPEGSALPEITWRSGNAKIAKVDAATGVVTGVKAGTTAIYAKPAGGKEVKCKVTVKAAPKKVTLDAAALSLSPGMSAAVKAAVPGKTASAKLTFASNNPDVASVDQSGAITALAPGKATITVKTYNGKKASCKVTVHKAPASVAFSQAALSLAVNQSVAVKATALDENGAATPAVIALAIDESSPDAGCVRLDESTGKLTAVSTGRAYLRATTHNGIASLCPIEVTVGPAKVSLNVTAVTLGVKEVCTGLKAKCATSAGSANCAQAVTWTSSNKKVARVDAATGVVTAVKAGTATITAKAPNGVSASCKVKVYKAPGSVTVTPAIGALDVGQSGRYKVSLPKNTAGSVTYSSSDPGVATVDRDGVVTAVSSGTAKITVTTYNGKSKTVKLVVNGNSDAGSEGGKSAGSELVNYVIAVAKNKLNAPYVYGSFGPNSFDCSGFMYWCFKQVNVKLKDSAYRQGYDETYPLIPYGKLAPGDLVFFNTVEDSDLSDHSGLYIGNGKFIHASSSAGKVVISNLTSGYYRRAFSWGRRVAN